MSRVRINCFTISLDGYGAGPAQSLEQPLGVGGMALHEWFFPTRTLPEDVRRRRRRHDRRRRRLRRARLRRTSARGSSAATCSARCAVPGPTTPGRAGGATNPPYHVPVFVLTHHARAPIAMEGGTTFHFVTDGIEAALERAKEAAARQGRPRRRRRRDDPASTCAPGWSTRCTSRSRRSCSAAARRCSPGIDLPALGFERTAHVTTANAMHMVMKKRADAPA